ncbi:MAG: DUF2345 domain-containing protein, partial [Aquabacterium sp.]
GKGLTMIAASGPIDLQAQAGPAQIAAKQRLELKTASGVVNIQAQQRVSMAVSGGAAIQLSGNGIEVMCPGTLTIKASVKSMMGAGTLALKLPSLPKSSTTPKKIVLTLQLLGSPGAQASHSRPIAQSPWRIVRDGGAQADRVIAQGQTDSQGQITLTDMQQKRLSVAIARWPNDVWLLSGHDRRPLAGDDLTPAAASKEASDLAAMAAMDFTAQPANSMFTDEGRSHRRLVTRALNQSSGTSIKPPAQG